MMKNTKLKNLVERNVIINRPKIITAVVVFGFLLYEAGYSLGRIIFNLMN